MLGHDEIHGSVVDDLLGAVGLEHRQTGGVQLEQHTLRREQLHALRGRLDDGAEQGLPLRDRRGDRVAGGWGRGGWGTRLLCGGLPAPLGHEQ